MPYTQSFHLNDNEIEDFLKNGKSCDSQIFLYCFSLE